jgi:hypothetical protein
MNTSTRHAAQYGEPLDKLRHQLAEARSRLEAARATDDAPGVTYWEAIIEQIGHRQSELEDDGPTPQGQFDSGGRSEPAKPPDMHAFVRRQLLDR